MVGYGQFGKRYRKGKTEPTYKNKKIKQPKKKVEEIKIKKYDKEKKEKGKIKMKNKKYKGKRGD